MHRLRIGLKKLRYLVENFLPQRHQRWGDDLKKIQDLLGEIHDLDVLSNVLRSRQSLEHGDRLRWDTKIQQERKDRVEKYREKMLGRHSLWQVWRDDLPQGDGLVEAAMQRLRTWAEFLDPDVQHSRHVAHLALELYDGLVRDRVFRSSSKQRRTLEAAALLHDVGAVKGKRAHHKESSRLIRKMPVPLGWRPADLRAIAAVARYHRGALPRPEHKCWRFIPASARPGIMRLAGVLRLANALDDTHEKKIRRLQTERRDGMVILHTAGYNPSDCTAERIAAARHLLEATCGVAIVVREPDEKTTNSTPG